MLFLNSENRLISDKILWEGTVNSVAAYPREILKHAISLSATALILIHNHISSDPSPSSADIAITKEIAAASKLLGIAVHDHLIVARGSVFSMAKNACIRID